MEATATTPQVIIPEVEDTYKVRSITFTPGSLVVSLEFTKNESTDSPDWINRSVDLTDEWAVLSATKKNDWKLMFKTVVSKALSIATGEITGDIWD